MSVTVRIFNREKGFCDIWSLRKIFSTSRLPEGTNFLEAIAVNGRKLNVFQQKKPLFNWNFVHFFIFKENLSSAQFRKFPSEEEEETPLDILNFLRILNYHD